jgi:hypothetical protein
MPYRHRFGVCAIPLDQLMLLSLNNKALKHVKMILGFSLDGQSIYKMAVAAMSTG